VFDFDYDGGGPGKGGAGTLFVNGEKVGQGRIEVTQAGLFGLRRPLQVQRQDREGVDRPKGQYGKGRRQRIRRSSSRRVEPQAGVVELARMRLNRSIFAWGFDERAGVAPFRVSPQRSLAVKTMNAAGVVLPIGKIRAMADR
jgi:hypothetical protein